MQTITAFLKLIRIVNLLIIALSLYLFYYLILVPVHADKLQTSLVPFTNFEFALFTISVMLIAAAGNVINDYYDHELDREYKPERPLAQGIFSLDAAMYIHAVLAFGGIGIGFYLGWNNSNYKLVYIYIICVILLYVYSAYLKKIALVGNLVVSALAGFVFVLLLLFEANLLNMIHFENAGFVFSILKFQVMFYGGFAFITTLLREIVKDLEDYEGDAAYDINTLPVAYGVTFAKAVALFVAAILLTAVGYFAYNFHQSGALYHGMYLTGAVALPTIAVIAVLAKAKQKQDYAKVSMLVKVVMLLGILSIPAFYWFSKMAQ
ncbi:MAG: geranylgeranylglycerol-phosphate geranylgeranyltransferase [Bacteroidetes bacterium]|nr:geranylgeranylglycerol-phosphate geranylgeranyltransferase [Bacteroidota bacterium]